MQIFFHWLRLLYEYTQNITPLLHMSSNNDNPDNKVHGANMGPIWGW